MGSMVELPECQLTCNADNEGYTSILGYNLLDSPRPSGLFRHAELSTVTTRWFQLVMLMMP